LEAGIRDLIRYWGFAAQPPWPLFGIWNLRRSRLGIWSLGFGNSGFAGFSFSREIRRWMLGENDFLFPAETSGGQRLAVQSREFCRATE
jgi:hypothetical protein